MAYGIKVYAPNGKIRLDTTDRQLRYAYMFEGNTPPGGSTTLPAPGLVNDGSWAVIGMRWATGTDFANAYIGTDEITFADDEGLATGTSYDYMVFQI